MFDKSLIIRCYFLPFVKSIATKVVKFLKFCRTKAFFWWWGTPRVVKAQWFIGVLGVLGVLGGADAFPKISIFPRTPRSPQEKRTAPKKQAGNIAATRPQT